MSDDHYNMILGAIIGCVLATAIFIYLFFNTTWFIGWGKMNYKDCQVFVKETVGKLKADCLIDYPELR